MEAVLGSTRGVDSLKGAQKRYLQSLISNENTIQHARLLQRIGHAHHVHRIPPRWHLGFTSHLLQALLGLIVDTHAGDTDATKERIGAVVKAMFVDMAFILDHYDQAGREQAVETIRTFGAEMQDANQSVVSSSETLSTSLAQQSQAAAEQATAVAEVTSTLSELSQTSEQALQQAGAMMQVAEEARDHSERGRTVVSATMDSMDAIRDRVGIIQDTIRALSDHTQQIGDIITTVNEIAEQSKLLALNASIEAARAGEYGRSFSVVANEMRDLAEQSKQATRQVRQLLSDIKDATGQAVLATEDGISQVNVGEQSTREVGTAMNALSEAIERTAAASKLIGSASRQQGAGVRQVADAMVNIDEAVRTSAQTIQEVQAVSDGLVFTGRTMLETVDRIDSIADTIAGRTT